MGVATLEDLQGTIEVIVFPKVFEQTEQTWAEDAILLVAGRVDHKGDETVLLADAVWTWEEATALGRRRSARAVARGDRGRRGGNGCRSGNGRGYGNGNGTRTGTAPTATAPPVRRPSNQARRRRWRRGGRPGPAARSRSAPCRASRRCAAVEWTGRSTSTWRRRRVRHRLGRRRARSRRPTRRGAAATRRGRRELVAAEQRPDRAATGERRPVAARRFMPGAQEDSWSAMRRPARGDPRAPRRHVGGAPHPGRSRPQPADGAARGRRL